MSAQIWDDQLGPLVVTYWATVERILAVTKNAGITNTAAQTIATGVMAERVAAYSLANSLHIAVAAGIAANNWS